MEDKKTRYGIRILLLDRMEQQISTFSWTDDILKTVLDEQTRKLGLRLIPSKEISLMIEYTNMIWNYRIYMGSCKKKYLRLQEDDNRWKQIENYIEQDLKIMGLEHIKEQVIMSIKKDEDFQYQEKKEIQFKRYCVK